MPAKGSRRGAAPKRRKATDKEVLESLVRRLGLINLLEEIALLCLAEAHRIAEKPESNATAVASGALKLLAETIRFISSLIFASESQDLYR